MLGLENGATHRFTAEAVVETRIRVTRRRSLLHTMAGQEAIASNLLTLVTRNLQHAEDHMLLLGRKNAVERVAAFLIEMDERLSHPSVMILPMSRRDIADYLGLTLETVSRALSIFRDANMLEFDGPTQRRVVLLDRKALANLDT
jgi:CRP/FNR family nitrogen fixation transcriptional regulator